MTERFQVAVICLSLALPCSCKSAIHVTDASVRDVVPDHTAAEHAAEVCCSAALRGLFSATGGLTVARGNHTATLLGNGKVLVAGGDPPASNLPTSGGSAELYDAAIGTFQSTGSLNGARSGHTATLLGNGNVLVAGGTDGLDEQSDVGTEVYDVAAGAFAETGRLLAGQRVFHTATLLPDGRVLIAGGQPFAATGFPGYSSAELYDPASGAFAATGSMGNVRVHHTATRLADGRVLVAGGIAGSETYASADLYDPATGQFTPTGSMTFARHSHTATLLGDGRVLIAGGADSDYKPLLGNAELYDPASGTFAATAGMVASRFEHTATLLCNGQVLLAGGLGADLKPVSTAEIYEPETGTFTATADMLSARSQHTSTLLCNGQVLLTGGGDAGGNSLSSAELYE